MTFDVAAATKRTFYIERRGADYVVVKVWEKGPRFTERDMAFAFSRVMETDCDERIVAEQSVSITSGPHGVAIASEDQQVAADTLRSTEHILRGDRLPPEPEDRR